MFFDPGREVPTSVSDVHFAALAGDLAHTWSAVWILPVLMRIQHPVDLEGSCVEHLDVVLASAVTDAAFNAISSILRETALEHSKAKKHVGIPLVLTYHPCNFPVRNVILKHFRKLGDDGIQLPFSTNP